MALILYPDYLPLPLQDGYGFQPVSPLLRSTKTSGRSQSRRNYGATPTQVAVAFLMNSGQGALFEKWFQEDLIDGSAWFQMKLRTPLAIVDAYKSRFVDIYEGPVLTGGNYWRYTATLEVYVRPLLPDGSTSFPDAVLNPDILDLALNREWPEA